MKVQRLVLYLLIMMAINLFCFGNDLFAPLKKDMILAIPIHSEDTEINLLFEDKDRFVFSIKDDEKSELWSINISDFKAKRLKIFQNKKISNNKQEKNFKLFIKKGKLYFNINGKNKWKRDTPKIKLNSYDYDGKLLIVLFKNGLLNIFSKTGTLLFWKTIDYKAKYILKVDKGFFIFSEKQYYFYDKKEKTLTTRKLNLSLSSLPIIIDNTIFLWGVKQNSNYFVLEKLSTLTDVKIDIDKSVYFKDDKLKIKITFFNLKKIRTTINLVSGEVNLSVAKKSKKQNFSIYLPTAGKNQLILTFESKEYKKKIVWVFKVLDKDKIINSILKQIYKQCFILKEER